MNKRPFAQRSSTRRIPNSYTAGSNGVSVAPPRYGISTADNQASRTEARPLHVVPKLSVSHFRVSQAIRRQNKKGVIPGKNLTDKSKKISKKKQDKLLSQSLFGTHGTSDPLTNPRGIAIKIKASTGVRTAIKTGLGIFGGTRLGGLTAGLSAEYRWTQTITTNNPLNGATSPYVDPHPNDDPDGGPFYYTTAEHKSKGNSFSDRPSRRANASKPINWDAVLSITSVHTGKRVSILESLEYGFTVNSDGSVTSRAPSKAGAGAVTGHISTLKGGFSDWKFSRGYL